MKLVEQYKNKLVFNHEGTISSKQEKQFINQTEKEYNAKHTDKISFSLYSTDYIFETK